MIITPHENLETETVVLIPVEQCHKSPSQPRRRHPEKPDEDFVASIQQKGVRQPIVVRVRKAGGFEIVFGHRRHQGSVLAKLATVPAIVREMTDDEVFEDQLIENIHRSDMHPLDEADGFKRMLEHGRTAQQIADKIGRPHSYVAQRLKLCELGKEVRAALDKEDVSLGVAVLLARVPSGLQAGALRSLWHNMSVNEAKRRLEETYLLRLDQAPFKIADAELVPKAGACTACPKRTGLQRELFPDVKRADLCTDPVCYRGKLDAVWQIRVKESKAGGPAVLEGAAAKKALEHRGDFKQLDDIDYSIAGNKTIRQLLGKELPPISLARDEQTGAIMELVSAVDVRKVLKLKLPRGSSGDSHDNFRAQQKAQDAKDRRRAAAVTLALAAAVERTEKLAPGKLIRLLTHGLIDRAWDDARSATIGRRQLTAPKKGYQGSESRLMSYLKTLTKDADVAGLGLELALRGLAPSRNSPARPAWGETLKALGVDFTAIEKQVAAEAGAKKKAKAPKRGGAGK